VSIYATLWTLQFPKEGDEHLGCERPEELHRRICDALRGNRSPVVAEVLLPDGTHKIIRERKPS